MMLCSIMFYWIYLVCLHYIEYLAQVQLYDIYILKFRYISHSIFINYILFLLSIDNDIYYYVMLSMYFINIVEFYINCQFYQRILYNYDYLSLVCLHIILLYFLFDDTSYMSTMIYMTTCLIIGIM